MFDRFNIVPRWIIFTLDLCCSAFALFFAYLLLNSFSYETINSTDFSRKLLVVLGVSTLVFYKLRMYAGIVRYTSALDSVRILSSVALCIATLFLLNTTLVALNHAPLLSNSLLIAYGLMNFLLLIMYRSTVKLFFLSIKNMKVNRKHTVIYGAGDVGIAAKRTLDHDHSANSVVIGFIDDNIQKVGKIIDGVRIYHTDYFEQLIIQGKVDELIISSHNIPVAKKTAIVDRCLAHNIKVLTMPPVHRLINGEVAPNQIQKMRIEDLLEREPIKIDNQSISKQIRGKRILVTGAAGSIGSEIARQLGKYSPQMIILNDQAETPLHELQLELEDLQKNQVYHAFIGDIRDTDRMESLFRTFKPHYVYHAAAYKHVPMMENHPVEAVRTNIMGTRLLARLAVAYGVEKFVMISTDKAVNPTNVMGASKRIAEIYVQTYYNHLAGQALFSSDGTSYTRFITTRFGNVLGSNGSVIPRFKAQIEKGGPVTVTHPEITRYFMTIPEACQLVLEAGSMGDGGEIYVFDMGNSVKIVELANKMIKLSGLIPNKDINIEYSGLRPGEKLYEELLNDLENTLPTHHHKIMIAKVRTYDFEWVEKNIDDLIRITKTQNEREIVLKMKELVPEFKSNNSIYEELDEKRRRGIDI
ncbi:polysaccharide biosynthesis protein [Parapedobacter sp. ISTM3]|uniref:NDP-sugar epimerase, includes UDP-GlcNAc-inverting 4,6-dehydratase FlaA1 and capsular polysaccharide biosynthesis protein EpsC n=1 Tax=Parapedobacter luteus TaxID=623280 RepID=A0A1T5A187_9SPHI|nr:MULTISPECIES: nucleoside-diphosphate sugar epimerase/dehydratase [Parapedobacter]MBK1440036.1 polysaccharide biosynthesis protein [Parapedobacter sp. ISTM3]SKB28794.1 NDP-sugar epimerase, includes UDP-GlcNAc-inverting 4,6-dehydratase FlaA1 and capsular polysaccharide biosynthesis protein EpsC [Parapedobacter luteus]